MQRPEVVIVTPALAEANNGNWRTARRWAAMLGRSFHVRLTDRWTASQATADRAGPAAMIALHARRSAASVQAWREAHPARPLVVVLTGTDLYRDIDHSAEAQRSLALADRLVVLQPLGLQRLPLALQDKTRVCVQSSPSRAPRTKPSRHLRALMVGHLREEKSPETLFAAARRLRDRHDIHIDHIGAALDPALARAARATMRACPRYRWLGALTHDATRGRIQTASVLVHCSRMEGGAQVIIEAVTSGTPVLASRIDGNLGLLGVDYRGIFPVGDAAALATLLERCRDDPAMLPDLTRQCAARAAAFAPEHEAATLTALLSALMNDLLETHP
jgi:putative glycosyltransferase (TIGR04348 family)